MHKNIAIGLLFGILILLGGLLMKPNVSQQSLGTVDSYYTSTTNSVVAHLATTSATILASNSGRQYAKCTHMGVAGTRIDVSFGSSASTNWGFPLYASQSFEITTSNLYAGPITGLMASELSSTSAKWGRIICVEK